MMMFIKLGFRNLWRNKRRSLLAGLAIGVGLASLMVADGFWEGMLQNMVKTVTKTYVGHAQLHHKLYGETQENVHYIKDPELVIEKISSNRDVATYTTRVLSNGMVNSAQDSKNIMIVGIDPQREKKLSVFHERVLQGQYIQSLDDVMIGDRLRKKLQVELGDRIVLTVSDIKDGELSQELFRVTGIYGMGSKGMDEFMAVIHQDKARKMLKIDRGVHEIAFNFHGIEQVDNNENWIQGLRDERISAKSWKDLAPQVVAAINMSDFSIGIIAAILLSLVALGILNTMFMSLYERMFEFGVLRALGTRGSEILLMIIAEAMALSLVAIIFGVIIGTGLGGIMYYYGIDYSGIEFAEMTFTEKIYFVFGWKQYVFYPMIIFIFTVFISLYPAFHATRITMSKALQKSL
jgi:ABC-type lipoprotein release transport system permease subunit